MLKKFLLGVVVLIGALPFFYVFAPFGLGAEIRLTCQVPPSAACQNRMLALGHIWSGRGRLDYALAWYEDAAAGGDPLAMFHAGWVEARSFGPNTEASANWYRRSAEFGFAPAMNNLGNLYLEGIGVDRDRQAAFRWHLAAAEAGNPVVAINTAIDYRAGFGIAADPEKAAVWEANEPAAADPADLAEPTLGRTLVFGGQPIPDGKRRELRLAAREGVAMVLSQRPLTPDPSLPTFREVRERVLQQNESAGGAAAPTDSDR